MHVPSVLALVKSDCDGVMLSCFELQGLAYLGVQQMCCSILEEAIAQQGKLTTGSQTGQMSTGTQSPRANRVTAEE